jgi:Pectate lyase superfamily protein
MKQQHVQHRKDGKTHFFSRVTAQYRQPCAAASIPAQRPSLAPSFAWCSHYYSRFHGEAHSELRSTLTARSDSLVKRIKKASSTLAVLMLVVPIGKIDAQTVIPSDRNFAWNPGMMSKGGIPNRTTVCATLSPSGGDDSAAIQAALNSCPTSQVVMLSAGTFTVNNYLLIHSSITLRGSGAGQTILRKTNGARPRTSKVVSGTNGILTPVDPGSYTYDAQPVVIIGPSRWPSPDGSTSRNLTVDGQQGASSVTITNASGFAAGQFVLVDELSGASWQPTPTGFPQSAKVWAGDKVAWNIHSPPQPGDDPTAAMSWFSRTDRPTNEIKEIASVSGNTIKFTSPLTIGYRVSHQAQLTRYTLTGSQSTANSIHVISAGIENLSAMGGADGCVRFEDTAYSWAKNIEVTQWIGEGIAIDGSFRVEIRDSYIHAGSWPEPGGAGYAISISASSSEVLIENNISIDINKVMVFRSSGAGTVVAYNYVDDGWIYGTESWVEVGLNASHMAGPHHILFEGNYGFNADSDYTHGNAIYLTFFRNWLSGQRRDFTDGVNVRTVGLAYGSWWDSFIGNILGRPGQMSGWHYTDPGMSCDANGNNCTGNNANWSGRAIWRFGYDPERWGMYPDPKTLSTVIRDGNYDFLTNSQRWHNTPGGFTIPNSMYLTSKPAFFGNNTWPWVNPTAGAIHTLPAKARYDAGTPTR